MKLASAMAWLLTSAVLASGAAADSLSLGLGYSTLRGTLAQVDLGLEDVFHSGVDLDLAYEEGSKGHGAALTLARDWDLGTTRLGADSRIFLSLDGADQDWDYQSYRQDSRSITLGFGAKLSPVWAYDIGLFAQSDRLEAQAPATTSALILSDMGKSHAAGLALGLGYSNRARQALAAGSEADMGLRLSGLGAARDFAQIHLTADHFLPMAHGTVLDLGFEGGLVQSTDGSSVALIDRAMLGGEALRGFGYAGLGPRDPATGEALGGTRYAVATAEVFVPTPREALWLSGFLDMGALWDLPGVTGVEEGFALRHALGLAVNYDLPMGRVSGSWAAPLDPEAGDDVQHLTLSISAKF